MFFPSIFFTFSAKFSQKEILLLDNQKMDVLNNFRITYVLLFLFSTIHNNLLNFGIIHGLNISMFFSVIFEIYDTKIEKLKGIIIYNVKYIVTVNN